MRSNQFEPSTFPDSRAEHKKRKPQQFDWSPKTKAAAIKGLAISLRTLLQRQAVVIKPSVALPKKSTLLEKQFTFTKFARGLCTAGILLAVTLASRAQVSTATINGVVKDQSDAAIKGATVEVKQTETNFTQQTTSGKNGEFSIANLPVGPYQVTVRLAGFATYEQSGLVLAVSQVATLPVSLKVGAQTETVVVTAGAVAVETTDNTVQSEVESRVISNLPLNGRNPADLVNTVAGVTNETAEINQNNAVAAGQNYYKQPDVTTASESVITIHGVRPGGTYFSLDGASNVDPASVIGGPFPNPDATQEFSVVTSNYGSRYVSAPGGAVNIVTRSGTNALHGNIFEFIRNGYFNADNAYLAIPDPLKRNQFGGTIGGPILKDKLFFFGAYQETAISTANAISNFVPTADERNGIFTSPYVTLPNLTPFFSPASLNLLKYIPLANRSTGAFVTSVGTKSNDHQGTLKADLNLGSHRLFARYFIDYLSQPAVGMTGNDAFHRYNGQVADWSSVAGGDTWSSRSGHWLSDARVSYTKFVVDQTYPATDALLSPTALGMNGITVDSSPGIGVYASFNLQAYGAREHSPRTTFNVSEDVVHVAGKHQFSFGGDYSRIKANFDSTVGRNPVFAFEGYNSEIAFGPTNDPATLDFLLGAPLLVSQEDGFYDSPAGNLYGVYAEDKYRVTDRLVLIAGLRWDPYSPYTQNGNRMTCFDPGQQSTVFPNAPAGLVFAGDSGCSLGGTPSKYGVVEPRVGFAYQLDKKGKLALRGGYGEYAVQLSLNTYEGFNTAPWTRVYQLIQLGLQWDNLYASAGIPNPFANGFQGGNYNPPSNVTFSSTPFTISALDKNLQPANTQQYSLSLQQAFTSKDSFEIAYTGNTSSHLANTADANLPVSSATASEANIQQRRPFQSFGQIENIRSDSAANYNGVDLTFRHQSPTGLSAMSAFTWSKCIDEYSQDPYSPSEQANNPRLTRGRCNFDENLSWRTTAVWSLPRFERSDRALRYALGSWNASGILTLNAGQPFSVTTSDNSYSGLNIDYADRIPNVPVWVHGSQYPGGVGLNYAAFANNAPNTYGNSGRNSFRSKKFVDADLALAKDFAVTKRVTTTFRAEAFNIFNHPNYIGINNSYTSSTAQTFGVYTAAQDPRIMQFSLKILF